MRIALGIEYDGANYHGWQRQKDVHSVQLFVEKALTNIANEPIGIVCAGRTDAGVHATGQVVHFDTQAQRPDKAWTIGLNTYLPKDISVKWVKTVSDDFHARFSATARRYRYLIYNNPTRTGIFSKGITHIYGAVDHQKMHEAAQCLVGEHDFTTFRAALCQANSPCRTIKHIQISRQGDYIMIDVKANAFLHHMVRNITGSLLMVGSGERDKDWLKAILQAKDRTLAGMTAKPNGLYLVQVDYPQAFALPEIPLGPLFL